MAGHSSDYIVTTPESGGCQSTVFSTLGLSYSRVCGQLRGYQYGSPEAFHRYYGNPTSETIDSTYVDGASITYSSAPPRKHIWTYANGCNLLHSVASFNCPCNNGSGLVLPPFVGSDYYCETGDNRYINCCNSNNLSNDTLWDGKQFPGEEAPCCSHPSMPWFSKTLNETTTA